MADQLDMFEARCDHATGPPPANAGFTSERQWLIQQLIELGCRPGPFRTLRRRPPEREKPPEPPLDPREVASAQAASDRAFWAWAERQDFQPARDRQGE